MVTNTKDLTPAPFRCLLYGRTGIGKTTLLGTAPKPFVIATEDGLEPLRRHSIDYARIKESEELKQLWLDVRDGKYETVCIDSLTALCDMLLVEVENETGVNDAMTTYPLVRTKLLRIINGYLKLPKHVIMTATETRSDSNKPVLPSVIGAKLCEDIARLFDHVQFMDFGKDDRVEIHFSRHRYSVAKDRTGELRRDEPYYYCAGYFEDIIACIHGTPDSRAPAKKTPPDPKQAPVKKTAPAPKKDEGNADKKEGESDIPFDLDL